MKRSKLFLGITTGILAVVGLTAAKAKFANNKLTGYYQNTGTGCTVKSRVVAYTVASGTDAAVTTNTAGTFDLYSAYQQFGCAGLNRLFTKAKE